MIDLNRVAISGVNIVLCTDENKINCVSRRFIDNADRTHTKEHGFCVESCISEYIEMMRNKYPTIHTFHFLSYVVHHNYITIRGFFEESDRKPIVLNPTSELQFRVYDVDEKEFLTNDQVYGYNGGGVYWCDNYVEAKQFILDNLSESTHRVIMVNINRTYTEMV